MSENTCPMCGQPDVGMQHEERITESVTIWHCPKNLIHASKKEPRELLRRKPV